MARRGGSRRSGREDRIHRWGKVRHAGPAHERMGKMKEHSRSHTFETPAPVRLSVENPKGRIRIFAEATETTRIELIATDAAARARVDEAEVTQSGEEIVVRIPRMGLALFGF